MEKFIALLTKGKEKAAMNEWKTDYCHSWSFTQCKQKIRTILFSYLLVHFFKQRFISSAKKLEIFQLVHKLSITTMVLAFKKIMHMRKTLQ